MIGHALVSCILDLFSSAEPPPLSIEATAVAHRFTPPRYRAVPFGLGGFMARQIRPAIHPIVVRAADVRPSLSVIPFMS